MIISQYIGLGILFALCALTFTFPKSRWPRFVTVVACLVLNAFFLVAYLFLGMRFALNKGIHDDAPPSTDFIAGVTAGIDQGIGVSIYLFLSGFALALLLVLPRSSKGGAPRPDVPADRPALGRPAD